MPADWYFVLLSEGRFCTSNKINAIYKNFQMAFDKVSQFTMSVQNARIGLDGEAHDWVCAVHF